MNTNEIYQKMHSGEVYIETQETLQEQAKYRDLLFQFNHTLPSKTEEKALILSKLLGSIGENSYIEPPFHANWGKNTYVGDGVYINFSLTLVDDTRVEIGDNTMIGQNVWIGANVTIFPGVTIGDNSVIGAGSIVTKDIPENVLAFGSPCKVVKNIQF